MSHFEAAAVLQSAFDKQATQLFVAALHFSLVASYDGLVVAAQSALARQPTQAFAVVSQTGLSATPVQSAFVTHSTQVFVSVLHAGLLAE